MSIPNISDIAQLIARHDDGIMGISKRYQLAQEIQALVKPKTMTGSEDKVERLTKALGHALDEVHTLRQLAAYEARLTEASLEYKSFPKSRREFHEGQVERLRDIASGEYGRAQVKVDSLQAVRQEHVRLMGHDVTLTVPAYMASLGLED